MNATTAFFHNGTLYQIETRVDHDARFGAKARAYVCDPAEANVTPSEAQIHEHARKLGFDTGWTRRGECIEIDRMWDLHNRNLVAAKRELLLAAIRAVDPTWEGPTKSDKLSFSRKAGCSCGCSPGFITDLIPARHNAWISKVPTAPAAEQVDTSWVDLVA